VTAYTTFHVAEETEKDLREGDGPCGCSETKHHESDCPCGCTPCEGGCVLDCLERPRYFCGQLLTDTDLTALVEWVRGRLGLVRYRDGWGVVCGLEVRCDPRKPSAVEIGTGYAVNCCGSDIVVCKPVVVDLSEACRSPKSLCDDPCAPKPEESTETGTEDGVSRDPWDCPDGLWVDILIDAADEEAGGRPTLTTDGCRRIGSCEASRVRETHHLTVRSPSAADPLLRAEERWAKRYAQCFTALDASGVPEDDTTYGQLRLAVERFALDQGCDGGCRALRWICRTGAPSDDAEVSNDVVQRVRLALLLDCLVAVGRCTCQTCEPGAAVMLARVLVAPGAAGGCPCRVVAVDDAPPYRRPIGHDCPPAALGRVNLGDLIGKRPEGVCLEVSRRGIGVTDIVDVEAGDALGYLQRAHPPIFGCRHAVHILTVADECLGPRVVGFLPAWDKRLSDTSRLGDVTEETVPRPHPEHPLLRIEEMTPHRVELLAGDNITSLEDLANAGVRRLRRVFPGTKYTDLEDIKKRARKLADEDGE
jgi:hypothetical protein